MDRIDKLQMFVVVVRAGTFSAAARQIHLTPSAVSKMIGRLEAELGVALFDRSTKTLTLTAEGEVYYDGVMRVLSDLEETQRRLMAGKSAPRGRLRITSSVPIGVRHIQPLIGAYNTRFPEVEIDLNLADDLVNLVDQQIDIAIRVGEGLQDSSLVARKLCDSRRVIVASRDYLDRHGTPTHPSDLGVHECLRFNMRSALNRWPFRIDDGLQMMTIGGKFTANNGETLRHLALSHIGVVRLAWFQVGQDVVAGRLVPLLEDFHPDDTQSVYALFFNHRYVSSRVRTFIDFLAESLGSERPFLGAGMFDRHGALAQCPLRRAGER